MDSTRKDIGGLIRILVLIAAVWYLSNTLSAIAIILATAIISIFLILLWLLFEVRTSSLMEAHTAVDFDDENERAELKRLYSEKERIQDTEKKLAEKAEGLHLRADGKYDERSFLGKDINSALLPVRNEIENINGKIYLLEGRPVERMDRWIQVKSEKVARRSAVAVYALTILILVGVQPTWLATFSAWLRNNGHMPEPLGLATFWSVTSIAALVSTISFYLARWSCKARLDAMFGNSITTLAGFLSNDERDVIENWKSMSNDERDSIVNMINAEKKRNQ